MRNETEIASVPRTQLVGLGSPYGDDQIGWVVARELERTVPRTLEVQTIRQPAELLDMLDDVNRLVVCDACQTGGPAGRLHRWTWPTASLATRARSSSHDLALPFVLALAERLGKLPREVIIWGVELQSVAPGEFLSPALADTLPTIVSAIVADLRAQQFVPEVREHA